MANRTISGKILGAAGTVAGGVLKGVGYAGLGAAGATAVIGANAARVGLKAGKAAVTSAGTGAIKVFGGAGTALAENLRNPHARSAMVDTWASKAKTLGSRFVTGDRGNMRITGFGLGALTMASWVDNSRDLYDKNQARNMGSIDNVRTTNTPNMTVPQYEFAPKKRMGALDGGASGSLVFALRNNR